MNCDSMINENGYKIIRVSKDNKSLMKHLYGIYSMDFIFNQEKFDIKKSDEVLHKDRVLLLNENEFMSCINDAFVCKKYYPYAPDQCDCIPIDALYGFTVCRRTTLDDINIDNQFVNIHPTPYNIVYEEFIYINDYIYNESTDDTAPYENLTELLKASNLDKNEAVILLKFYNQGGFRLSRKLTKALFNAEFKLFKYDNENKVFTFIKYPTLQSFSR